MDRTAQDWMIPEGANVVDSSGDKVGKVVAVQPNYLIVEKGFFFPAHYFIPASAISNYDGDTVYLNVTKDQALNQGWDTQPTTTTTTETTDTHADRAASTETTTVADRDTINVPVREEELSATSTAITSNGLPCLMVDNVAPLSLRMRSHSGVIIPRLPLS